MDIGQRAGVDFVGYYRCTDRQRRALRQLGSLATKPAVDWELFSALKSSYPELDPERDNRSVGDPEWVEKGLARYGCPVHGTRHADGRDGPFGGASGHGSCSCGSRVKRSRANRSGSIPVQRNDWNQRSGEAASSHAATNRLGSTHQRASVSDQVVGSGSVAGFSGGRFSKESYRHAVRSAYSCAGRAARRGKPLSVSEVVSTYIHMDNYAGAPYFCSNRDAVGQAVVHADLIASGQREFDPYVAGHRIQHGSVGPKTRLVWMAPLGTTILATRFSKVIHRGLERLRPFAWGLDSQEKGAFVSEFQSKYRYTYSLDYSGFDASLGATLIRDAFNIMEQFLVMNVDEEELYWRLVNDFIHSRLLNHDRKMYRVHRGVPSGSAFTSQVDSICNLIILNYIFIQATGKGVDQRNCLILGDDAIVGSHMKLPLADVTKHASELGIIVSVEKSSLVDSDHMNSEITSHVNFLGHYWVNATDRREEWDLVKRMVFPERHAKRDHSMSWMRFLSYSSDAQDWWLIANKLFRTATPIHVLWRILQEIDDETIIDPRFQGTGYQRYLHAVENRSLYSGDLRKGMKMAIHGRVA